VTRAKGFTVGLNWFLNRMIKFQLNYARTTFKGGKADGEDREDENAILTRIQVAF
jgi:phosphate-selective porin OprO/OprP